MSDEKGTHTLSMAGSRYGWSDFDNDASKLNKTRSGFLQFLYEEWKEKSKKTIRFVDAVTLLMTSAILLLIIVLGVLN